MARNPSTGQRFVDLKTGLITIPWLSYLRELGETTDAAGVVDIRHGGTGATTAAGAKANLGIGPGGAPGQLQYNQAGNFGGITISGDGTLNTSTGALIITKTNGVLFGPLATDVGTSTGTGALVRADSPTFTGTISGVNASFSGTVTGATAVFASLSGEFASLTNTSGTSQLHLSGTGNDEGGYFFGASTNAVAVSGGATLTAGTWTAKATTANILFSQAGNFAFFADSGLTIGATFTPTVRFEIDLTGTMVAGIVPVARISGLAASATTDTTNAANIISGTLPAARLPNPSATTLGGVQSKAAVASNWLTSISTGGVPAASQPAFSDISGTATAVQGGTAQTTWTLGDLLYSSASNTLAKLAGNTTSTKKYLSQTGTGTVSGAPSWAQVAFADISGTATVAQGGTGDTGTAWTAYTPTVTAGANSFTTVSAAGAYKTIGKTTFIRLDITVTTNGTASTSVIATLPNSATSIQIITGREVASTGKLLQGLATGGNVTIVNYDNTYPAGSGTHLFMSGSYEST